MCENGENRRLALDHLNKSLTRAAKGHPKESHQREEQKKIEGFKKGHQVQK